MKVYKVHKVIKFVKPKTMSFYNSLKNYLRSLSPDYYEKLDSKKIYIKYVIGGGIAAFVDLFLLYILTDVFHFWYLHSAALAFLAAFFVSFYLQKFWTFRDNSNERIRKQMALYFAVGAFNLGVNTIGIYALVEQFGLAYIFAQIIMGAVIAVSSFLIYRFVIFRQYQSGGLKVLIATGIFPPDIGGPATYSKLLADELPKRGIEVEVLSFGSVRHLPKIIRHFAYFLKVLAAGKKADVIYAQDPVSVGLPVALAAKSLKKKFILKIVGDYAWEQGRQRFGAQELLDEFQEKKYSWKVEFLRFIQKKAADRAALIIVPSRYLKSIIIKWGIGEDKIRVVYNAVPEPRSCLTKEEAKKKLDIRGDIIFSAGRLVPWKGFGLLIELMPALLKINPDFKLIIAGDGGEREYLENKAEELRLNGKVFFTGAVSHEKIFEYMRASDMFVLNTGYEGLPHITVEAMRAGAPVITTNVGGNAEVIKNGENGILLEYNDKERFRKAILEIWRNKSKAREISENAKQSLDKFNQDAMIKEIIFLLRRFK